MLLAVDTSTKWVNLALYDGAQVVGEILWQTKNHHTVELSTAIYSLLERCGASTEQLEVLAVALGPGSFTSLRIGLAIVKGMSLALGLPVVGIPTLDILAASQPLSDLPMIAILQAGRGRLATAEYINEGNQWKATQEAGLTTAEQLASTLSQPTLICGELTAQERQLLKSQCPYAVLVSPAQSMRRPSFLAEMAWNRWKQDDVDDVVSIAPLYLHVADPIPE